jgi:Flp pilus assembly protein TadG
MSGREHRRSGGNFARDRNGAVTIEFVVTFPLFLAALAFAFEFGRLFVAHHTVVNNVRAAARYLARSDLSATAQANAEQIVRTGAISGGTEPSWMSGANIVVNPAYAAYSDADFIIAGQTVQIRANIDFPLSIFGFTGDGRSAIPFGVVEDERHIGS